MKKKLNIILLTLSILMMLFSCDKLNPPYTKPIANFNADNININIGNTVRFTDLSTNSPESWSWDFGDGFTSTLKNPTHIYTESGIYSVSLTVTNSIGSDTKTKNNYITVNIPNAPPVANFTANSTQVIPGEIVYFTDLSLNNPLNWKWNFGDGNISTLQNPSHAFDSLGTYTISLIVSNSYGSDTLVKTNYITVEESQTQHIKKVLVEDYTGHLCPNCPAASEVLENLVYNIYPGQVIPIAMHVGALAMPITPTFYGEDFRTTEGDDISSYFGNADALPNGFVNRRESSGSIILSSNQWGSTISDILNEPQSIDFGITNTFDTTNFKLNTKIDITFLQDFTQSLYLCVYLTEDSLIGWQKDNRVNPDDVQDYVFHHVMRGSLNGTWGEKIQGTTSMNNTLSMEYNNFQLDTSYAPVHCAVVVFAYDSATYEIYQADEKPILDN